MTDQWASLRSDVGSHSIGQTFNNDLLVNPPEDPQAPQEIGTRVVSGGTVLFSDNPETITGDRVLADGTTTFSDVGYNVILFTDTAKLATDTRYRLFVHHVNHTGAPRTISVRALNRGSQSARLKFGLASTPTVAFGKDDTDFIAVGITAVNSFLGQVPVAQPSDLDSVPEVTSTVIQIPVSSTPTTLWSQTLSSQSSTQGELLSAITELVALDSDIQIYVVMGDPADSYYTDPDDGRTAEFYEPPDQYAHRRGTFPYRLVTRTEYNWVTITTGGEEDVPRLFRLVTNDDEAGSAADTHWSGQDRVLNSGSVSRELEGNYGRMHYAQVTVSNSAGYGLGIGILANPRDPSSDFGGVVRDVGAGANRRVPQSGHVLGPPNPKESDSGTVVWKSLIPAGGIVTKRLRYTPAGASSAKLNLWVVPYSSSA